MNNSTGESYGAVCVIGGAGMLGAPVVRGLLAAGRRVRVVGRSSAARLGSDAALVEFVCADVRDPAAIETALRGCTSVHISLQGGPREEDILQIEGDGVVNVVAAARRLGIERVTMLSGTSVAAVHEDMLVRHRHIPPQIFAKYCGEEAVRGSGMAWRIYRAANFIDGLERSITGRYAFVPAGTTTLFDWITADDYAKLVVADHAAPAIESFTATLLAPDRHTIADAMAIYIDELHPGVRLITVPRWILAFMALFSPALHNALDMLRFTEGHAAAALSTVPDGSIRFHTSIEEYCRRIGERHQAAPAFAT